MLILTCLSNRDHNTMLKLKNLSKWMSDQNVNIETLVESSGLDRKTVESIVAGRYTTSPKQRQKLANGLGLSPDEICWGKAVAVEHMYGHGPQFGRSP